MSDYADNRGKDQARRVLHLCCDSRKEPRARGDWKRELRRMARQVRKREERRIVETEWPEEAP